MAHVREFHFDSSDGKTRIHAVNWLPDRERPRAVLQLAHGIAEYILRYDEFARFFADHGIAVVGNDHLGHGGSFGGDEYMGYFADENGWSLVVNDMYTLYRLTKQEYPDIPYFLLGHSMGSFLARTFLIRHPGLVDGCILSGTGSQPRALCDAGILTSRLVQLRQGKKGRSALINNLCFGSYTKKIENVRTAYDWLSRDEAVVNQYILDDRCGFIPTIGLVIDMLGGIKYITNPKNLNKMDRKTPVYFYAGAMDPVGEYGAGVQRTYDAFVAAGCRNVSIKLYPDGRHEMHNELNKDEVYADVLEWIEKILLSARPAAEPV